MANKISLTTNRLCSTGAAVAFIGLKGIPAEFIGTSGVEFYVERRAKLLVRQGKTVTCYVRNWATPKSITLYKGIHLVHLSTINTKHLDATIHSLLSSIHVCFTDADTVWYQAIGPAFFSFLPKVFGKKIIVTSHALDWKRDKWGPVAQWLLKISERVAVACADNLVVVSGGLQEYYLKTYRKNSYIDPPDIVATAQLKPSIITKKYKLEGNDYILYMGRFVPEKRIDWLIKAYLQLKPSNIKLVLAGGSSHTDEHEKKLRYLAANNTNIIFTNYVFKKEKQELLHNCMLFVLPSSLEGNSTVLKEVKMAPRRLISNVLKSGDHTVNTRYFENDDYFDFLTKLKELLR